MFFQITTQDFQSAKGSFDIITVQNGIVYINSARNLLSPFVKIDKLPDDISTQLEKDLELAKEQKKDELEQEREKALCQDIEYKGSIIQAEQQDRELINEAVNLYSVIGIPNGKMQYITKDNSFLEVTLEDLIAIMSLMGQNKTNAFIKCRLLKNKVNLAKTVNEVQAIKWDE